MRAHRYIVTAALLALPFATPAAIAAPAPPSAEVVRLFEVKVRPLLAGRCYACHGAAQQKAGLRLDSRAALLKGGSGGPVVVPGDPEKSLLVRAVNHQGLQMPPGGKLSPAEIAALTGWVRSGAYWPEAQVPAQASKSRPDPKAKFRDPRSARARSWWAFKPVRRPAVPTYPRGFPLAANPVDHFVYQKLAASGLTPAPEADPATLIRRVTFDLTGLPPTPEEVEAFVRECAEEVKSQRSKVKRAEGAGSASSGPSTLNSQRSTPYDRLVDRLLDSPRYGERMARQWLDLVRYADSDGYRADEYRPNAWRYRDYVIKSFNEDRRYDRFVQEQLAGDELFPGQPDALIATGYLRHWIYEWNQRDVRGQWETILNDLTDTTGDVFLGLGMQCARCHDHKFDPILQKDYYRLQAFFAPILPRDDLLAATPQQVEEHRRKLAAWESKTADLRSQIEAIEARYRPVASKSAIEKFTPDLQAMIFKPVAQREPLEHQLAELAYRQVTYEMVRIETHVKGEDKERLLALKKELAALDGEKPQPLPVAFAATDAGPRAPAVKIPKRGDEPVEPGFPTVLDPRPASVTPPAVPNSTGRRAALARWLTQPDNPLTARILVNRVWQGHFGRGLVENASDFGSLTPPPSHPELLDWLATSFASGDSLPLEYGSAGVGKSGSGRTGLASSSSPTPLLPHSHTSRPWSLKSLHRLIVTSATYRQAARHPAGAKYALKDPENRLYWRGNTRRLEAEQIRDALLTATGELDLKAGGPGVPSTEPRRTIYTRVMRNTRDPLLDVFDLPQFFTSASSRDTTTTPVQSLLLVNSQLLLLRARALAARVEKESGGDPGRAVERAYRLAYGRAPTSAELAAAGGFLEEQARRIDPREAGSAAAAFLHDRIPFRDGQGAVFSPDGPQRGFEVPGAASLPEGDFTVEAFVLPRSVYDSGAVRTIAARWNGDTKAPGWAFGITGRQSRRKPQTLVLQLIGRRADGSFGEEALFADRELQLNRPYYVAAAVQLAADGKPGTVTFFLKDLANDDEPLLVATVPHRITAGFGNALAMTIGNRGGEREAYFDGLIDDIRFSRAALDRGQILFTAEGSNRYTAGYWPFEAKPDVFRDASGNGLDIRPAASAANRVDPRQAALVDFCHALLNSNEFLYVD